MPYGSRCSFFGQNLNRCVAAPGYAVRKAHVDETSRLRGTCEARLDALQLPWPLDLDEVARIVGEGIERSVSIVEAAAPDASGAISGLALLVGDHQAVVAYDPGLQRVHRTQVILHELAHLVCGHRMLMPEELTQGTATRHGYRNADEDEAEMLASLMYVRCTAPQYGPGHGGDRVARRFSSLLFPERRTRWRRCR
jgi:hypothetical protein